MPYGSILHIDYHLLTAKQEPYRKLESLSLNENAEQFSGGEKSQKEELL